MTSKRALQQGFKSGINLQTGWMHNQATHTNRHNVTQRQLCNALFCTIKLRSSNDSKSPSSSKFLMQIRLRMKKITERERKTENELQERMLLAKKDIEMALEIEEF